LACMHGSVEVLEAVLAKGGALTQASSYDGTPLEIATKTGRQDVVQAIIVNLGEEFKANQGTSLFHACNLGFAQIVTILLKAEADPNLVDPEYGRSCLLEASRLGFSEIVSILLDAGASVITYDTSKNTPLYWAVMHDNDAMIETLLAAYMGQKNANSESALSIAEAHHVKLIGKKEGSALVCKNANCRHIVCKRKQGDQ